jgi:hypothetical protein
MAQAQQGQWLTAAHSNQLKQLCISAQIAERQVRRRTALDSLFSLIDLLQHFAPGMPRPLPLQMHRLHASCVADRRHQHGMLCGNKYIIKKRFSSDTLSCRQHGFKTRFADSTAQWRHAS